MNNTAIIVKINNIEKHPNADNLQIVRLFGTQVITGMDTKLGDLMIYFDSNLKLSSRYLSANNLYRHSVLNADSTKIGYFDDNGRVKAIKLRGEFSDGVLLPLESLLNLDDDISLNMDEGTEFTELNKYKICEKYIVPVEKVKDVSGNKIRKSKTTSPMFVMHWDSDQYMRNKHQIPADIFIYIEEKVHGTSQRTGNVIVSRNLPRILVFINKLFGFKITKENKYTVLNGTRRTILTPNSVGFHDNSMRDDLYHKVKTYLFKGEEIYTEIIGFENTGRYIQKGFPYGCDPVGLIKNRVILYRVTMNNEDGITVDYSRDAVYSRAEELGLEKPTLLKKFHYTGTQYSKIRLDELVLELCQGRSTLDDNTLREGVVLWFMNKHGKWTCLKHKSEAFKEFESKAKDKGEGDIEDIL